MSERAKLVSRATNSKVLAGLEKLKKLKSGEGKIDDEEEVLFEYLDEDEYSEVVKKRTENDWIVDDGGTAGYYEDGREIFDDDDDEDSNEGKKYTREYDSFNKKKVPIKKNRLTQLKRSGKKRDLGIDSGSDEEVTHKSKIKKSSEKGSSNIKSYLISNQKNVAKKTFDQMQVEDDDLLKSILDDINVNTPTDKPTSKSSQQRETSTNLRNKRKLSDFDEDLIPSQTPNNPFSVATETNSTNTPCKKAKTECFEDLDEDSLFDNELPDSLFEKISDQVNNEDNKLNELDFEIKTKADQSFSIENLNFENDENIYEENGIKYLNFYWLDVYEDYKEPGIVYLFGKVYVEKVKKYLSCCIICKNVEHKIFVYPRTHFKSDPNTVVTMDDVEEEIKKILFKHKIKNFRSKTTAKNYAFEKDIVTKSDYLEVHFKPLVNLNLPSDLNGDTFSHVFNYNQSSLERFILDLKLKGPAWLKIKNPDLSSPPISWCKFEYILEKPFTQIQINTDEQLIQKEVPLSFMTFSIKTYLNSNKLKGEQNEILSISCLVNGEYYISKNNDKSIPKVTDHFCLITKPSGSNITLPYNFEKEVDKRYKKTKVKVCNSEREMISLFIVRLFQNDPDILIGHDIQKFDLDILLNRMANFKLPTWSKLSRLRRSKQVPVSRKERYNVTVGRLMCDTIIAAQELIRAKSYDLNELSRQVLKKAEDKKEINPSEIPNYYKTTDNLIRFIDISMIDTKLINDLFIELNVIPLYSQITKIAGNIFSRTLLGGRAERNEYLLLHAFNEKNYILPEKNFNTKYNKSNNDAENFEELTTSNTANKRKKAYTGGLVLDPKVGFYDKYILLMDFNSLYPSIIQEYKICFTTVDRRSFLECLKDTEGEKLPELNNNLEESVKGILPTEISNLVKKRRAVKLEMCKSGLSNDQKQQLDIQQKALKLTANSMYGCLGFSNSRFYARPLAALITAKGREILRNTKELIESLQSFKLEIIYGDTDSLMINTNKDNYDEAENIGYKLKAEINKRYEQLEIDIDGVFKSILLLKKKKYAAIIAKKENGQIKFSKEVKGLDIVRRDWSVIAKKVGEKVLDEILSANQTKQTEQIVENIHNYLSFIAKEINEKRLTNNNYVINMQLTKNPEEYKDRKGLSHVQVALRMNETKKRSRPFKKDDTIPYVVCKSKENKDNFNNLSAAQRAFHIEELKENSDLEIDSKYYLENQIHPVVSRLCDPIDGTDANLIAEFLGIESHHYTVNQRGIDLDYELLTKTNETRYDTCKSLIFTCPNKECKKVIEIRNLVEKEPNTDKQKIKLKLNFDKCPDCSENFSDEKYKNYFLNHLKVYCRSLISEYYQTWFTCEDSICQYRTRKFTSLMTKKGPICPNCNDGILHPNITDAQIYLQFSFFVHILDVERVIKELPKLDDEQKNEITVKLKCLSPFYKLLLDVVQNFKRQMAFYEVDLTFLFSKQVFSFLNLND